MGTFPSLTRNCWGLIAFFRWRLPEGREALCKVQARAGKVFILGWSTGRLTRSKQKGLTKVQVGAIVGPAGRIEVGASRLLKKK
jgi:hypothetical protein